MLLGGALLAARPSESAVRLEVIKTWSDVQTLKAMVFNLRGEARTWYTMMKNDVDEDLVDTLANFIKAFLDA